MLNKGTISFNVSLFIKRGGFLHSVRKQPINNIAVLLTI